MARTGKNNLRRWEYPADSGIGIREIINRNAGADGGLSYRVTIPARLAGVRRFKQFTALDRAEKWAKEQSDGARRDGQKHFLLTPSQQEDAIAAIARLESTGLTLVQAVDLARKHVQSRAGSVTVKDAVNRLVADKEAENLRERSVRDLRNRLDFFAETFGEKLVAEITTDEITRWLHELGALSGKSVGGLSNRSKKNYLITVRTFFNWSIAKGYRGTENPASTITTPKIDWEAPSILTVDEARKLLKAAQTEQNGRLLAAVILGLFAGIRSNEIMRLDWSAIDLEEKILTIGSRIAKKRRLRVLELMPNCVAWLKTIKVRKGRVAPGRYTVRWAEFVKAAGFPDWGENRSNAMRHSFGSYHYALHSDAAKTASMLGHRANDQVLFDSYRSLTRKKEAEAYFALVPS